MLRTILTILMLWGLTSCTKKPEYPISTSLKQFPSSTAKYTLLSDLPYLAWWQQFNDPQLNQLIDKSLKNNRDIHVAIGNLQQAQAELKQVKLSWIPSVVLNAGYSTNPALGFPYGFYGATLPYYAVNIMQLYSQQKRADYFVAFNQAALAGIRLAVIGQVSASYFTLIAQIEQLRLLNQLDKDLNSLIHLSEGDIKIGLENQIDLAQLQSDERLVAAQMKPIMHHIVLSQNALRYLINQNPGWIPHKNNFAQIDFTQFKPGSIPMNVLNNRPDMKMAAYALKAAKMDINIAYSSFFPAVQLDDYIWDVHLPQKIFFQAQDAYGSWSFSPNTFGKIDSKKGAYNAKRAEFVKTIKRILKEVDTDYSKNKQMNAQFLMYARAEKDYHRKYTLQEGLLNVGLISYKELVQSKIYLDNLALSTNQAKLELAMSLVLLYQDLAGGYAYHYGAE
jgi:outer membrane protein TolC